MFSAVARRVLFLILLGSATQVCADTVTPNEVVPVVDGKVLSRIAVIKGQEDASTIQYVAQDETFADWSRLVVYSNIRSVEVGNDPKVLGLRLIAALQQFSPGAKYKIAGTEDGNTVLLDFLSWPQSKSHLEFSVYRIEKGDEGKGVYSVQMSARLPFYTEITDEVKQTLQVTRASLMQQISSFNMVKVKELMDTQAETK